MRNPLYSRIESIAAKNTHQGRIKHSAFDSIRNRQSVRTVLLDLGYKPDDQTKPMNWGVRGSQIQAIGEPGTQAGREVLNTLLTTGIIYVAETTLNIKYLRTIIHEIKQLGYNIKPVKDGCFAVAYQLIRQ